MKSLIILARRKRCYIYLCFSIDCTIEVFQISKDMAVVAMYCQRVS